LENPIISSSSRVDAAGSSGRGAQIPEIGRDRADWSDNRADWSELKAGNFSRLAVNLARPRSDQATWGIARDLADWHCPVLD
jgi:hypothetical protein